jgi:uncharacterized protein (TIGR03382 family)
VGPWILLPLLAGAADPDLAPPPFPAERALHLWSLAARFEPDGFPEDLARGGCAVDELPEGARAPVGPVSWQGDLAEAARVHSADRAEAGSLSHDSTDGTSMVDRIQAYYGSDKPFAENLARGYPAARQVVLEGWMCSPGHRDALLDPRWDAIGTGEVDLTWTAVFGRGDVAVQAVPVAVHAWEPEALEAVLRVAVAHPDGLPPEDVRAVVDGVDEAMPLTIGEPEAGIHTLTVPADGRCTPWFVEVAFADEVVRYPARGSLVWGDCDLDAPGWVDMQLEPGEGPFDPDWTPDPEAPDGAEPPAEEEVDVVPWSHLCATVGPATTAGPVLLFMALLGLRRRRR